MSDINYLVTLCRAYLEGESITVSNGVDFDKLYRLSNRHNLSAIVFAVLNTSRNKDDIPENALSRFESDFLEAFMRYQLQGNTAKEVDRILSENEIPHIQFKGVVLRELYPVPEARVMGDVDVLISKENRAQVKALLKNNGFVIERANGPVYNYLKDGVKIEMHTSIINGKAGRGDVEGTFANAMEHGVFSGCSGTLEDNYHFAYLIAHIAHHFMFYGAGLKLILDLAVMLKKCSIDLDRVFEILDKAELSDFAKVILTLCFKWFGCGRDYGADTAQTEEFLINYGAFGNINRNNAAVIERRELEEGKINSGFATKLRLLFPSYKKLKDIDYIRFIEGRPYLTPAAWVYRVWYNFKYKRSFVKGSLKAIGSDETKGEAEKEFAYFKEIGLL